MFCLPFLTADELTDVIVGASGFETVGILASAGVNCDVKNSAIIKPENLFMLSHYSTFMAANWTKQKPPAS